MSAKTKPTKRSPHKRVAKPVAAGNVRSTFRQRRFPPIKFA